MDNEKLNILKLLIENQEQFYSIRQIALELKINYKTAYLNLDKLKTEGVITLEKQGNTTSCKFNRRLNSSVYETENYRLQEILKDKDFKIIHNRLGAINEQFIVLLFGSHVRGKATKESDIDLLLISDSPQKIEEQIELIPLNIHLTSIKYPDFISMVKSKEFSVVSEAIKKNIIFFGIEDYYRLLKNGEGKSVIGS